MAKMLQPHYRELAAASIVAAIVSRSLEVESFRSLVKRYRTYLDELDIESQLDYLASVLITGHLGELKMDMFKPSFITSNIEALKHHLVHSIARPIIGDDEKGAVLLADVYQVSNADLAAAHLAAAYIEQTNDIETRAQIATFWDEIRYAFTVRSDLAYITLLLLTGHIRGMKNKQDFFGLLENMFPKLLERLQNEPSLIPDREIAFLVAAYCKGTDTIESTREIVQLYTDFAQTITFNTIEDRLAAILLTGKFQKMTQYLTIRDIRNLIEGITQLF